MKKKKTFHETGKKTAGVGILILDKTDFKTKAITRDKEGINPTDDTIL